MFIVIPDSLITLFNKNVFGGVKLIGLGKEEDEPQAELKRDFP